MEDIWRTRRSWAPTGRYCRPLPDGNSSSGPSISPFSMEFFSDLREESDRGRRFRRSGNPREIEYRIKKRKRTKKFFSDLYWGLKEREIEIRKTLGKNQREMVLGFLFFFLFIIMWREGIFRFRTWDVKFRGNGGREGGVSLYEGDLGRRIAGAA